MSEDSCIEILDVEELPAQDELITVLVPTVDDSAGLVTGVVEIEKETYGRVSIGLDVGGGLPVKLGLDYERSTTKAATLEVTFAAGFNYLAYGPLRRPGSTLGQQLEICWATRT